MAFDHQEEVLRFNSISHRQSEKLDDVELAKIANERLTDQNRDQNR